MLRSSIMEDKRLEKQVKKLPIGALKPGDNHAMIVALVIGKSDPKRFVSKWDGKERWVTSLTLRDSAQDMINLTVWCSREEAVPLRDSYHTGEVVEVVRPRVVQREEKSSSYSPQITSWLELKFQEGKTNLAYFLGNKTPYMKILNLPTKASSNFLSISDILNNSGSLRGHHVDLLAAVRSVGKERTLPSREEDLAGERKTREVRLFDHTGDSLVLKLWDSDQIRMSSEWIPRENVLFIADVRVDFDSWKKSFVVTSTSKTIITVNPDTQEAANLSKYAQSVDFSTKTRMDQYIANIDVRYVDRILNISSLQKMLMRNDKDQLMTVNIYGFISKFDIDCPDVVTLKCGACSGSLKPNALGQRLCTNLECRDYQNLAVSPNFDFAVRADISDETGSLVSVKVHESLLTEYFGSALQMINTSEATRTQYKWKLMLKPLKLTLAVMLSTGGMRSASYVLVSTIPVTMEERTIKMPSPTL